MVVHVACPLAGLTAAVAHPAIVDVPSVKRTVPAFGAGETAAVSVTGEPGASVGAEALIVVAVGEGAGDVGDPQRRHLIVVGDEKQATAGAWRGEVVEAPEVRAKT